MSIWAKKAELQKWKKPVWKISWMLRVCVCIHTLLCASFYMYFSAEETERSLISALCANFEFFVMACFKRHIIENSFWVYKSALPVPVEESFLRTAKPATQLRVCSGVQISLLEKEPHVSQTTGTIPEWKRTLKFDPSHFCHFFKGKNVNMPWQCQLRIWIWCQITQMSLFYEALWAAGYKMVCWNPSDGPQWHGGNSARSLDCPYHSLPQP